MGEGPTAYFIPGRVGWGVGPRQIVVCRLSSVCLSVVCLSPPRDPPATHPRPTPTNGSILDRSWIDPWSILDRSLIDPWSILDRSLIDPILDRSMISYMFFPWPMYKRCAAKNNHRRLANKGELLTTSKWCSKCQQCNLPITFAGRCSLQGQNSWPKGAFYRCFCKMMKNRVKYNKTTLFSPVGVPCRGKNPGQNVYFIYFSVNISKIM